MTIYKTIAKIAALLAILGLVLSSFALTFGAEVKTPSVSLTGSVFTRDLTVGSSGAEVTALQNWLISKGFAVAAGATGYFGEQTRGALARYQASVNISPAVGYFGPITRAKVNATTTPSPTPEPSDDDEDEDSDNDQSEAEGAEEAHDDAVRALEDAREEVEEAEDDGALTSSEERLLDDAEDILEDAEEELRDENYDQVMDLVDEAMDLIDEALEGIEDRDEDSGTNVSTSAEVNERDGADNDFATFQIEVDIKALGDDIYISRNAENSFNYEIQDSTGDEVTSHTSSSVLLRSTADEQSGYYVIEEGEKETFTLTVTLDPLAADEGAYYRLQLIEVLFNTEAASPNRDWNASPASKYRTNYVYIID